MKKKATKVVLVALLALIILWGSSEIIIPMFAVRYIREKISNKYPGIENIVVTIRAFPALKLAFQKYDTLKIHLDGAKLEGFTFSILDLESNGWPSGGFTAVLSEDEINRFFTVESSKLKEGKVSLEDNRSYFKGKAKTSLGYAIVTASGSLEPRDGRFIFFIPEKIEVGSLPLGEEWTASIKGAFEEAPIYVVRKDLPYRISTIRISGGNLKISGTVELDKILSLSRQ